MQINLNLSQHAINQLNIRYPHWTKEKLKYDLKVNPTWELDGEFHTYIGTGFDIIDETGKSRKRHKRRHLFLVSKKLKGENYVQVTAVFHTTNAILTRINNKNCIIHRDIPSITPEIDWKSSERLELKDNISVYVNNDKLSSRKDILWDYAGKLVIPVYNIN